MVACFRLEFVVVLMAAGDACIRAEKREATAQATWNVKKRRRQDDRVTRTWLRVPLVVAGRGGSCHACAGFGLMVSSRIMTIGLTNQSDPIARQRLSLDGDRLNNLRKGGCCLGHLIDYTDVNGFVEHSGDTGGTDDDRGDGAGAGWNTASITAAVVGWPGSGTCIAIAIAITATIIGVT